jgi:hypothetical protein
LTPENTFLERKYKNTKIQKEYFEGLNNCEKNFDMDNVVLYQLAKYQLKISYIGMTKSDRFETFEILQCSIF